MDKENRRGMAGLTLAMVIFGTIGLFRKFIPLDSALLAFLRGSVGGLFLLAFSLIKNRRVFNAPVPKKNLAALIVSGGLIGINWVLLFEAYNYTSVATATLCYYMAPVFVIFASPLVLRERLTAKKIIAAALSLLGMALVSGVIPGGFAGAGEMKGVLFGLGAAALYASVILLNKKITGVNAFDKTVIQMFCAALAVLPYVIVKSDFSALRTDAVTLTLIAVVCLLHTGVAYALYFGSMEHLGTQTIAVFGYLDPVVALLLSQLASVCFPDALPNETPLTVFGIIGAVLILGSAVACEINLKNKRSAE